MPVQTHPLGEMELLTLNYTFTTTYLYLHSTLFENFNSIFRYLKGRDIDKVFGSKKGAGSTYTDGVKV